MLIGATVDSRYLAPVGSQNSRARVKWFSRYLALSREGHDSWIQDHRPTLPSVYNSQTVCWAIIEVLTFPGSLHTSTSHQRQITTTLDFNNYATKLSNHTLCKATHDEFCVEISQTTSRLDRKQKWFHACATAFHQSWMSSSVTNSRIAFQITKILTFWTQYKYKIGFGPTVESTCQLYLYQEMYRSLRQLPFFVWCWSECDVTYGILSMAAIVCWQSEADCAESKSEPNVWNTPD